MESIGRFVAIVLTTYRSGASQRNWRRCETTLCTGRTNHRMTKKKWRGKWLEVVVMKSVSCLLFTPVGRLVSHQLILFLLFVHHLNPLVLPFLSISEYTTFKSISRRRGGGSENTSGHTRRRPDASSRWSKWGWQSERSWLLVIGSWYPWNKEMITHQSRTQLQLPSS